VSTPTGTPTAGAVPPVLARRWLAAELGQLRVAAGLTQPDTAAALGWSVSKVLRVENGQVGVSQTDVAALAALYGVSEAERVAQLRAAAARSRQQTRHREALNRGMLGYLAMEDTAVTIRMFRHSVIPDLLQTVDYAHAVYTALAAPGSGPQRVERRVQAALDRRVLLDRPDLFELVILLDEAVPARLASGDRVMRDQLAHLRLLADRPTSTIRYVPYELGVHQGHDRQFTLLEFGGDEPAAVYRHTGVDHAEPHPDLLEYRRLFTVLESAALDLSTQPHVAALDANPLRTHATCGRSQPAHGMVEQAAGR